MNEFDIKASEWDNNPMHWDRSKTIAKEIIERIPLTKEMSVMEYGAGTGITSFILKDYVKEITLMDNSLEMVKVMDEKIKRSNVKNLHTVNVDLEHTDYKERRFDLIFNQMVLHHVGNIETILKRFNHLLKPGGYLAIADLYEEDGSFHGEGFTGHLGFNPDKIKALTASLGFINLSLDKCFEINKKISDTETKKFDIFLLIAKRD